MKTKDTKVKLTKAIEYSPLYYDEKKKDPSTDPKNHNIIVDEKLYSELITGD